MRFVIRGLRSVLLVARSAQAIRFGFALSLPVLLCPLASASDHTWVRNTYPGPGHVANPGPWGPGQGTDRTEWISFFRVHPTNPKFMLQGTDLGRVVYTNTALGGTEFVAAEMPLRHACTVAFNPHEPGTAYVLMDRGNAVHPTGWYRSTDEGLTWTHFFSTPAQRGLLNLLVVNTHPNRANHIYIGTLDNGVHRSTDNGATFQPWRFAGLPVVTMSLNADGSALYVLTGGETTGTLHRINASNGQTVTYAGNTFRHLDMHPTDKHRGIIVDGTELKPLTVSGNGNSITLGQTLVTINRLGLARYNPANPQHIVAVGNGGMIGHFRWTTDGGATWAQWESINGWSPNFVDYGPSNWKSPEHSYPSAFPPNSVRPQMSWDFLPGDPQGLVLWETGYHKGPKISADHGRNLVPFAHGGNFKQHAQLEIGSNDLVRAVSFIEAGVLLTNDGGRSWRSHHRYNNPVFPGNDVPPGATGLDLHNWRYRSTWGVGIDPTNDAHVLAVVGWKPVRILRTQDFGVTWTLVGEIDSDTVPQFRDAGLTVKWDRANPSRVYVWDLRNDDVTTPFTSLDGSFTPGPATTRLANVVSAISPANGNLVVHKHSGTQWRFSQNAGATWVNLPAPGWAADGLSTAVYSAGHLGFAIDPDPMRDPTLGAGRHLRLLAGGEGGVWQYQATNASGSQGAWSLIPGSASVAQPGNQTVWLGTVAFDPRPGHHQKVYSFGRYVGFDARGQLAYRQAYKSSDGGLTWTTLYGGNQGALPDWMTADLATVGTRTGALFVTDFTGQYSLGASSTLVADSDISENFDAEGSFAATFHQTLAGKFTETAEGGLGGTRGLLVSTQGSQGTAILQEALAGDAPERTLAIHFRYQAASSGGGQPLYVGLGPTGVFQPNLATNTDANSHHLTIGLLKHNTDLNLATLRVNSAVAGTVTQTTSPTFVGLVDGNWYKLTARITYNGSSYTVGASLDASDELGFVVGTLLTHTRSGVSVPALAANPAAHAFFGGQGAAAQRGIHVVDNFLVLP